MTCGLVLAGGASSRMGQPKALLPLGSQTMIERLLDLFSRHCSRTIAVTGAHHNEIETALPHLSTQLSFNPHHESGMFSSLRHGLAQLVDADAILFSPVDFAAVSSKSIAALFDAAPNVIVKPRYNGASGHPVLIRKPAITALLAAPPDQNAKAVLSSLPSTYIDVADPAVAQDCDTPEDYTEVLKLWRRSV